MKTPRRGYALIEMLVFITAMMIILGLCVGLIQGILKLDRVGRAHLAEVSTRGRLARQFRQDVRASARAEPVGEKDGRASTLRLHLHDGPAVEYHVGPGRVVREEHARDKGDVIARREAYRLRRLAHPRFDVGDDFVGLLLPDSSAFGPASGPREFRIEARLNGDYRLSASGEKVP